MDDSYRLLAKIGIIVIVIIGILILVLYFGTPGSVQRFEEYQRNQRTALDTWTSFCPEYRQRGCSSSDFSSSVPLPGKNDTNADGRPDTILDICHTRFGPNITTEECQEFCCHNW